MGNKKDQHNSYKTQDVSKVQCQKTTEYYREPKQAKCAQQVKEIPLYQWQVKTARTKHNDQHVVH